MVSHVLGRHEHLTFKGNLRSSRYGWLRLTPAFSVHLVAKLVEDQCAPGTIVLDPFCGTGTTALVCAERGFACDTTDINPFLLWLTRAKTRAYDAYDLDDFRAAARSVGSAITHIDDIPPWVPPLHQIERWWSARTLAALGRAIASIQSKDHEIGLSSCDLLRIAFTQTMIAHAHVSFGHQSMSFRSRSTTSAPEPSGGATTAVPPNEMQGGAPDGEETRIKQTWENAIATLADAARSPIRTPPCLLYCDARNLLEKLPHERYGCVITSPPYPNRMSYIRELRPYMYWLGYLTDGRQAGNLDWQAIGGTWGCATSNLAQWKPEDTMPIPFPPFEEILARISTKSRVLGRYVAKYFYDMLKHCASLFPVVSPGGSIHYIVGNSKFYDILLPVESIFASMFEWAGFVAVGVQPIRKRTSKRELFEFVVSARKPNPAPAPKCAAARP